MADASLQRMVPLRAKPNKWLTTVSITFGTLMGAIDASIVNVALFHIRGSVGATTEEIAWISTGFIIATVMVMPLTAFLGRQFGQKRVYMASLVLFICGSMLCGLATSLWTLVAFRFIQGLGAGALQPTEQAILRQTFPPEEQGMAMALFAMAVMVGPAVGPTLGGYITDHYAWQWIFYINLPVGILGLFMVWRFVYEPDDVREANRIQAAKEKGNMDWWGIGLLWVGLATMQFVLEEGTTRDWFESKAIVACTFIAVFGIIAFVIRELSTPTPAVNLRLFKDKTFLSGTLIGSVMFAMLQGSLFILPLFMQEILGFTATDAGLALMPRTLIMMVAVPVVGKLYNKVPPALFVAFGVICFSIGQYVQSGLTAESGSGDVIVPMLITGFGFACLFVPLTTAALSYIPRANMTDATGLNSLMRQIGGSIGVAAFATYLTKSIGRASASVSWHASWLHAAAVARVHQTAQAMIAHGYDPVMAQHMAQASLGGAVARQGSVLGFEKLFLLQGIAFLCVLPLLFFLKVNRVSAVKVDVHMD